MKDIFFNGWGVSEEVLLKLLIIKILFNITYILNFHYWHMLLKTSIFLPSSFLIIHFMMIMSPMVIQS